MRLDYYGKSIRIMVDGKAISYYTWRLKKVFTMVVVAGVVQVIFTIDQKLFFLFLIFKFVTQNAYLLGYLSR